MVSISSSVKCMAALVAVMLFITALLIPAGYAQSSRSTVQIQNASHYAIYELYLSSAQDLYWRQDLLGNSILWPGWVTRPQVVDGTYDLKLVDEDGDMCVIKKIRISGYTSWQITDRLLLYCEF